MVVFVDKLVVQSKIGWFEEERNSGTELRVSIRIDINSSVFGDELSETIDYAEIAHLANAVSKKPIKLIETYIEQLKDAILFNYKHIKQISSIFIRVEKEQIFQNNLQFQAVGIEQLYIL